MQAVSVMQELLLKIEKIENVLTEDGLSILENCQQLAISIGNMLENNVNNCEQCIRILEMFCEKIYQISIQPESKNKLIEEAAQCMKSVSDKVEDMSTMPVKILFLPYKAAMWDSMESVWKAAREDCACNVYVVPIPYYDLSSDKAVRLNYEGDLFPDEVDVIDWKDYDLGKEQPDIIVVHNAYDDCNLVTRVKEDYFSANLKQYTDLLVYIPYFITSGVAEAHTYLPSYQNFDKIIVQNEGYVKEMKKCIPENKLIPLGSPKCDAIVKSMEDLSFPIEWEEKLRGKKILFFNLSLSCLLAKEIEEYLDKVEYLFQLVEKSECLAMVWRPHPLLESTINAMRNNLRERIQDLQERCRKGRNLVYDTMASPERAIAISDLYIGERESSITTMFFYAKKPIFLLTKNRLERIDEQAIYNVNPFGMWHYQETVYYFALQYNMLCKLDLKYGKTEIVLDLTPYSERLITNMVIQFRNELWILLDKSTQDMMLVYNCDDDTVEEITSPMLCREEDDKIAGFFCNYDDENSRNIYFRNKEGRIILKLDTVSRVFTEMDFAVIKPNSGEELTAIWMSVDANIYCLIKDSNKILQIDLQKEYTKMYQVGSEAEKYTCFSVGGGKFYFTAQDSKDIYTWDPKENKVTEIRYMHEYNENEQKKEPENGFCYKPYATFKDKNVVTFLTEFNCICELSCTLDELKDTGIKLSDEEGGYDMEENIFAYQISEHEILFCLTSQQKFLSINIQNGNFKKYACKLNGSDIKKWVKRRKQFLWNDRDGLYACRENEQYILEEFIEDFSNGICDYDKESPVFELQFGNADGMIGERIYKYLLNVLKNE